MIHPFILFTALQAAANPAPLNIDSDRITVSGVSSGAYVAQQLHLAYSDVFKGVGVVAGGPWACADGQLATAMAQCMGQGGDAIDVDALLARFHQAASAGKLADPKGIADDPVWLFRGRQDGMVAEAVAAASAEFYRRLSDQVLFVDDMDAAHHFPTLDAGGDCATSAPPFIGNCGFDAAGQLLAHLDGPSEPAPEAHAGELRRLPVSHAETAHLLDEAVAYLPEQCANAACGVHVVLHGCGQSSVSVGEAFIEQSGYLRWADARGLVLLFPQVRPSAGNPYACFDWWGYSGEAYLYREAVQMQAIVDLVHGLQAVGDDDD